MYRAPKTITLPSENFRLAFVIFSKIVRTNMDWSLHASVALSLTSSYFNCPTNSIC